ncbi:hypothetical protein [Chitinophaga agri]|uniref:Quinol oxidase subunit 4 n=1 Tax=Chitinophaga agri TaxID=2703787 RepID=A0A6B9ZER0_9BACT|nr:hypothetical protein [Chitinophaga agri]QHS59991.1 hypothetical protein GWR21_10410 [Chitinophaga agri]
MRTKSRSVLMALLCCLWVVFTISSCAYEATPKGHPHGMPPGQAKKLTGSKSAKPFAPGQQKKYH